jgi:hypothetical protein
MMMDTTETLSTYETELRAWMSEWYDRAFANGFIQPPFILSHATAVRLEGYFNSGLTPAEGAKAIFCVMH